MKVDKYEYDENLKDKGSKVIKGISISALSLIILLNSCSIYNYFKDSSYQENSKITRSTIASTSIASSSITNYSINYSNVQDFYDTLLQYKNRYGNDFAASINSFDDAKSLYTFVVKFDDMYAYYEGTTNITSIEEYENILNSFFSSCIKYDVKPFLSVMFKDKGYYYKLLSEAEELTYNLKNSLNNDYTIANEYFAWLGTNLWYGQTSLNTTAIRYGKNNVLDINGRYDFTCPAGVDQFIRGYKVYDSNGNLIDKNEFHEVLLGLINNQCETYKQNVLKRGR